VAGVSIEDSTGDAAVARKSRTYKKLLYYVV
jgi:hypothetical protein